MLQTPRRAFTLIELLVVIAVIALLIAILMPALGGARKNAKSVECLAHMRQIGIGWTVYAEENKGVCVPGQPARYADESKNVYWVGNGNIYRPRWFAALGSATSIYAYNNPDPDPAFEHSLRVDNDALICSETPDWRSTRNSPYGYNYQFLGNTRFVTGTETTVHFPVKIASIEAAHTVMFADSLGTAAGKPAEDRTPNHTDGSRDPALRARGGHGYVIDPPRLTADSDYADSRNEAPEHRSAPDARHSGKANAAFCDGHVSAMTLSEMGYVVGPKGEVLANGPGATNKLFSGLLIDKDPPKAR